MKQTISNIALATVIIFASYLVIANIIQIISLNKTEKFDFDGELMGYVDGNLKTLEENVEELKTMNSTVYTLEEKTKIVEIMEENVKNLKSNKIFEYKGVKKLKSKDLLEIDLSNKNGIMTSLEILENLSKYDKNLSELKTYYHANYLSNITNNNAEFLKPIETYKYTMPDFFNDGILNVKDISIMSRVYNVNEYIVMTNYIAILLLEIGGDTNE